ncbi:integrator complex subunit 11 [Heterostelium album PN500]|uniref:Integrator complex subunit 11 n=1 Tax=Heterostelium pallidum (strain ATCC 26659 / Pp 5 / PN500) TaxID=670386 RepID=D3BR60_HETP5|nr:integrator complex subunit 11 [Heterostelium album PN500]EFA75892.1 integrator complex subunit 11 [Heterostelium album PN500]|eukprot:XP_020428026.1 integrator complex subunit 11 [Heterostelium album PN500]
MGIKVVPLGAGQDVGRSCVIVSIGNKNIMFDCGMHMGYHDERRFPDFSFISKTKQFTKVLDCVIITHFHLDHCGALPYFTEICGYDGPIYMTVCYKCLISISIYKYNYNSLTFMLQLIQLPTKAIVPILLEDYRKIVVDRKGETNFFTPQMIKDCMKKVIPVALHQTIDVDDELSIKPYYAGHVLGAAMFYCKVGEESVVYTGDYNMTPDRHLGSAWIDAVNPTLLITETTYATTIRDSKRGRERDFLKRVHECVEKGGKVLIPVFALGRVQELCILIDTYWEQMGLSVPIYFSEGLAEKANFYYKLFIGWTNQKIKQTFVKRNMFDFKHIKPFDRMLVDAPGPMVLFATPGMLHAGASLEVFKKWAPSELNMTIIPGYCVVGTVGNKLLSNASGPQMVEIDKKTTLEVKCKIHNLSFSAHADAKGIMQLIKMSQPKNVLLVHGEKEKMRFLSDKISKDFNIPCYFPANGVTVNIESSKSIPIDISLKLLKRQISEYSRESATAFEYNSNLKDEDTDSLEQETKKSRSPIVSVPIQGIMVSKGYQNIKLLDPSEASKELSINNVQLNFILYWKLVQEVKDCIDVLYLELCRWLVGATIERIDQNKILVKSSISIEYEKPQQQFTIKWTNKEEYLSEHILSIIQNLFPK